MIQKDAHSMLSIQLAVLQVTVVGAVWMLFKYTFLHGLYIASLLCKTSRPRRLRHARIAVL